ncbi:L-fucose mutarotase [Bacillota bacterium Meth-B3]|nr:L-fucose mutarotase [Christensenellaceae bacterium]MEA5068738.1 L-fucose mutarotase [Christensenellaceae bacterium]
MLKGISPLLSPDLLKVLAEMGHGDELVIGDANFPAQSMGQRCVRADGVGGVPLLDAILALLPLDTFVAAPVHLMQVVPGSMEADPPIWSEFQATVEAHQPGTKIDWIERFEFYDRARKAYACVSTSERALYACVILKKGVL